MKTSVTAIVLAIAATGATAQPFEFQRQFNAEEYVHGHDAAHLHFVPVEQADFVPSLHALMLASNVDGIAPNDFVGTIVKSGPSRISLYEVLRDSPEGIAYRDYHARYPADTDWGRIAREYREGRTRDGLAADIDGGDSRS